MPQGDGEGSQDFEQDAATADAMAVLDEMVATTQGNTRLAELLGIQPAGGDGGDDNDAESLCGMQGDEEGASVDEATANPSNAPSIAERLAELWTSIPRSWQMFWELHTDHHARVGTPFANIVQDAVSALRPAGNNPGSSLEGGNASPGRDHEQATASRLSLDSLPSCVRGFALGLARIGGVRVAEAALRRCNLMEPSVLLELATVAAAAGHEPSVLGLLVSHRNRHLLQEQPWRGVVASAIAKLVSQPFDVCAPYWPQAIQLLQHDPTLLHADATHTDVVAALFRCVRGPGVRVYSLFRQRRRQSHAKYDQWLADEDAEAKARLVGAEAVAGHGNVHGSAAAGEAVACGDNTPFVLNCSPGGATFMVGTTSQLGLSNGSYTVEAWVRIRSKSSAQHDAVFGCAHLPRQPRRQCLHLVYRQLTPHLGHYDNDTEACVTVPIGEWHHIAFVYDDAAQTQSIIINGVEYDNEAEKAPLEGDHPTQWGRLMGVFCAVCLPQCVGRAWNQNATHLVCAAGGRMWCAGKVTLDGEITEGRVWRCARTAADVRDTMRIAITSYDAYPTLASCWSLRSSRLDDGTVFPWTVVAGDGPASVPETGSVPAVLGLSVVEVPVAADPAVNDDHDAAGEPWSAVREDCFDPGLALGRPCMEEYDMEEWLVQTLAAEVAKRNKNRRGPEVATCVVPRVTEFLRLCYTHRGVGYDARLGAGARDPSPMLAPYDAALFALKLARWRLPSVGVGIQHNTVMTPQSSKRTPIDVYVPDLWSAMEPAIKGMCSLPGMYLPADVYKLLVSLDIHRSDWTRKDRNPITHRHGLSEALLAMLTMPNTHPVQRRRQVRCWLGVSAMYRYCVVGVPQALHLAW